MPPKLGRHRVVLLGIGHTNAYVLRKWKMRRLQNAELICVSNFPVATYSGMLPGVLARQYSVEEMQIDLVRLCESAGARLIVGDVTGWDREMRELQFANRPPLAYDWLSIGAGSRPTLSGVSIESDANWVAIKPMQTMLARLEDSVSRVAASHPNDEPFKILIIGGGVGGVEVSLCLPRWLKSHWPEKTFQLSIIHRSETIAGGVSASAEARIRSALMSAGVECIDGQTVVGIDRAGVTTADGSQIQGDLVLWATGAVAPSLMEHFDLPMDSRGFLLTRPTLQSTDDDRVLAVGDSGSIEGLELPKAGVYAVRQGPVLWRNLKRALTGQELLPFRPQPRFLKLVNLGDGRAIADYANFSLQGSAAWRWKDRIDRKFMRMYQDYSPMMDSPASEQSSDPDEKMYCAGCGSKVGAQLLSRVLKRLEKLQSVDGNPSSGEVGLDAPDDVALVDQSQYSHAAWTVDYFTSPIQEPAISGRLAALHSASDLHAKGLEPTAATAIIQIPHGDTVEQERWLFETLAGAVQEFSAMGCRLVGGHTIESDRFALGFSMLANTDPRSWLAKSTPQAGDVLVATKALGTGILFAAQMRCECRGDWYQTLLDSVLTSNSSAGRLAAQCGAHAVTDITGFGLAGHLYEMLSPSKLSAQVDLGKIRLLPGVKTLVASGIESSLAPANRHAEHAFQLESGNVARLNDEMGATYAAMFDPQTCGGLLISISPEQYEKMADLFRGESIPFSRIGMVSPGDVESRIVLKT